MDNSLQTRAIATSPNTESTDIQRIFQAQQANKQNIKNTTAGDRKKKLKALKDLIFKRQQDIRNALAADFRKPEAETDMTEIYPVLTEVRHAIDHVSEWMRPLPVETPISFIGSTAKVMYEPKGVTLIISPWNYPFNLCLIPLVSAIAAGNTAILKPSEYTPNTSKLVKSMMAELFAENEVAVIEGDHRTSSELLKLKFDHIFFTGSPQVGKVIMRAAAENLTSVTLELGGKSPVIVDETANIAKAARRIAWGKFMNNGQTCVAPDYLYVHESKYTLFIDELKKSLDHFYGADAASKQQSGDYARIVNARHHDRLKQILENAIENGGNLACGGQVDDKENYIAPTIVTDVSLDAKIMQEEIFGPILPVFKYSNLDEPLAVINSKEKPLALYVFSTKDKNINKVLNNTSAGGTAINDVVTHVGHPNLPFGGANNSGIGNAHAFWGFKAFSHERALLRQPSWFTSAEGMFPPYNGMVKKLIDFTLKYL
ncbi:aldehyde dehydrogenase family protein [soil metagenome]